MAQMFKQKLIKPGRDFNYSEGQKVLANAAIKADQIVYIMGSDGPFSKVDVADADAAGRANGRLLIAKHDIPAGGYGICLPWKLVTTLATTGAAVGDPVFLSQTPGTTVASNLTLTAPTAGTSVIVGRVTVANVTVANGAAIMVQPASPEERSNVGTFSASATVDSAPALSVFKVALADTNAVVLTLKHAMTVLDAFVFSAGTTGGNVDIHNGAIGTAGNRIFRIALGGSADATVRQTGLVSTTGVGKVSIAAGGTLEVKKSAGDAGDYAVILAVRT